MSSNILVGACIALGILGTWNTMTLYKINKRLDVIENIESPTSKDRSEKLSTMNRFSSRQQNPTEIQKDRTFEEQNTPSASQKAAEQPTIDLMDPEIQETIAKIAESNAQKKEEERRKSKMEAYKTSIKFELENFAEEKQYDTETTQSIETILDDSTAEWRAVREQVREGEISWIDARTEFKAIGEETEGKVTEFISAEDYKELRSRLWGDWGQ